MRRLLAGSILLPLAVLGCDRVQPPQITAETVTTGKISPQGADMDTTLAVMNPNKNSLTASNIQSSITLGGKSDIARAVITDTLLLPAGQKTKLKLPIHIEWTNQAAIKALADAKQPAKYAVTGTVSFSTPKGAKLETPFQITGFMSVDELQRTAGVTKN